MSQVLLIVASRSFLKGEHNEQIKSVAVDISMVAVFISQLVMGNTKEVSSN